MLFLNKRVEEVKNGDNKELIWVLEHPKTYTAGVSFKQNEIIDKKIKIIKTNRGGKITLHNPGQKIIYFVINLNNRKKDIRKFINTIEVSVIEFLKF
jgi:lipoyl(octanoyl) transferase